MNSFDISRDLSEQIKEYLSEIPIEQSRNLKNHRDIRKNIQQKNTKKQLMRKADKRAIIHYMFLDDFNKYQLACMIIKGPLK